jgi:hypothetical protein
MGLLNCFRETALEKEMKRMMVIAISAIALAGCQNLHTLGGATLGGLGGAYGGSQIGKGKGKLAATAAGALLGAGTAGYLGSFFDQVNRNSSGITHLNNRSYEPGLSHYQAPVIYTLPSPTPTQNQAPSSYQMPMQCKVVNNYVQCSSR